MAHTSCSAPTARRFFGFVEDCIESISCLGFEVAYFIIALRSIGLDAGSMGGFERSIVDATFFADGRWVSQYLVNVGYGDDARFE